MKVTIIGGGNIGMCLAGEISRIKGYDVTIFASHPEQFQKRIFVEDVEKEITFRSSDLVATDDLILAVKDADVILCTFPAHLRKGLIARIEKIIKNGAYLGFFPGYGGAELFCRELIQRGITIFAVQKVPYVARTRERGKVAGLISKKKKLFAAAMPHENTMKAAMLIDDMLMIKCLPLKNYMAATLLPGNPLLHTCGSAVYLKDYQAGQVFPDPIYYYRSWTDECSELICKASDEMMKICEKLPLDLTEVESIQKYYESETPADLTRKFHSIPSFQILKLPMLKTKNGYIPDLTSRWYVEDIPHGVCILKALAQFVETKTPAIDQILDWYRSLTGKEYFMPDRSYGKDIHETVIPQLFGINSAQELAEFYSM